MKLSVHDNYLFAYEVDSRAKRIILHTEYAYGDEPFRKTDVIFEGALDHYFKNPVLPSIVFDIREVEARDILMRDKDIIDEGHRIGGWPSFWSNSVDTMCESIINRGCKIFEISSSYGLDGWVVAASCEFTQVNESKNDKAVYTNLR